MASKRYPKAPITEAIIDIRTEVASSLDGASRFCAKVADDYPTNERLFEGQGLIEFEVGGTTKTSATQQQTGFKISSRDGLYIAIP